MAQTYAAIDVETTGLDYYEDAIIEVGVVIFSGDEILDEFTSLVNPGREIPPFITKLTGITERMVAQAPSIGRLRTQLQRRLDDHILVGHNVGFDLSFLHRSDIGQGLPRLDTLVLGQILLPEAGRYGLGALASFLQLPGSDKPQTHRALDDVKLTVALFQALRQRAMELDIAVLDEIVRIGRQIGWTETLFFAAVLEERIQNGERPLRALPEDIYDPPKIEEMPLVQVEDEVALDIPIVVGMIEPGGNFSRQFPQFEHRSQQAEMMKAVAEAFNNGEHLLVEAGTGTGKSVGYLLPAAFWASANGRTVVVSTNTINLQDQLLEKDIPALQKILPFPLQVAVRKGKRNYLCTRLFQNMRHRGPTTNEEMALYARILHWLPTSETGDVAELNLRSTAERLTWGRLSAENDACNGQICAESRCPLFIAKRKAERAHILIVNHSLLLADAANDNHILPPFDHLIIDEAHHLESAVTDSLSFQADKRYLEMILNEIIKPRTGLLSEVQLKIKATGQEQIVQIVDPYINNLRQAANSTALRLEEFFTVLSGFLQPFLPRHAKYSQKVRITPQIRASEPFAEIIVGWENVVPLLKMIGQEMGRLIGGVEEITDAIDIEDGEDMQIALISLAKDLDKIRDQITGLVLEPNEEMIYWIEWFKERITLHAAPLNVGPLIENHLFNEKEMVILTSATLRTAQSGRSSDASFDYVRNRLHAQQANELAVGSPFDYPRNTLLYLPTDMPEPNQAGYQKRLEEAVVAVSEAVGGRTLVLFTSYSQLNITAKAIEKDLNARNITLLAQTEGASRQQLLKQFKQPGARAVLLGTRSFWEGVDVPGVQLQAVLIAKLPFDVPSDPVFAARSETFSNSFMEYSIPEAVLHFRQGFGRLIRRKDDEGIVVVLDKRVLSKRYGEMFIRALPETVVLRQRLDRLGELTSRWFNRDRK